MQVKCLRRASFEMFYLSPFYESNHYFHASNYIQVVAWQKSRESLEKNRGGELYKGMRGM